MVIQPDLILCGGSVRSLAESAVKAGLVPFCVDYFGDEDLMECLSDAGKRRIAGNGDPELKSCLRHENPSDARTGTFSSKLFRGIKSPEDLENAISTVPLSVPLVWCGGFENSIDIIERIRRHRPVCGAAASSVQLVRNPRTLSDWCHSAEIRFPETYHFDDLRADDIRHGDRGPVLPSGFEGSQEFAEPSLSTVSLDHRGLPNHWLLKSTKSAGGLGVSQWESSVSKFPEIRRKDCYLQQRINGQPFSAVFCADHDGTRLIGCSLLLSGWECAGAPQFHYSGNYGPIRLPTEVTQKVIQAGRMIAERSGLRGVFGIDFVLRDTVPWLIEVNPRLTASHELFDHAHRGCLLLDHLRCFAADLESSFDLTRYPGETAIRKSTGAHRDSACDSAGQLRETAKCWFESIMFRLILYSKRAILGDDAQALVFEIQRHSRHQGENVRRSVSPLLPNQLDMHWWLGDIPSQMESTEMTFHPGTPVCSLYVTASDAEGIRIGISRFSELTSLPDRLELAPSELLRKALELAKSVDAPLS